MNRRSILLTKYLLSGAATLPLLTVSSLKVSAQPTTQPTSQSLGPLDFRDVKGYMRRLRQSKLPFAVAIRQQIAAGPRDVKLQRQAIRRAGMPLSLGELKKPYAPVNRNAAPFYTKLSEALRQRPLTSQFVFLAINLDHEIAPTAAESQFLEREMAQRSDVTDLMRQATSQPMCAFQRNWQDLLKEEFVEGPDMIQGARMLRVRAYIEAKQGRYKEAIDDSAALFRVARHAASDPTLESLQITASNVDFLAFTALRDILALAGANAEVAGAVQKTLKEQWRVYDLRHHLSGDMVRMALNLAALRRQPPQTLFNRQFLNFSDPHRAAPSRYTPAERHFVENLIDASEASMLRRIRYLLHISEKPDPQRLEFFIAAENRVLQSPDAPLNPLDIFQGEPRNTFLTLPFSLARLEAKRAVLATGAALLAYKAQNGSFPDQSANTISFVNDPFTSQPLNYRREGDGFVVFSVGSERRFDGGQPGMKTNLAQSYFRYTPLEPKQSDVN